MISLGMPMVRLFDLSLMDSVATSVSYWPSVKKSENIMGLFSLLIF